MANQEENDEIEIQHRTLIEEEDIDISDLPSEIRNSMREFNKKLKKYEESGDSKLFFEIQQDDVAIANNILTFIEDEESEEEEETEEEEEGNEEEETTPVSTKKASIKTSRPAPVTKVEQKATPVVTPVVTPPVVATPTPTPTPTPAPTKSAEEQVKEAMKDGVISVADLERIINQEPDYPNQVVGSLKLRKQYLRPYYELSK